MTFCNCDPDPACRIGPCATHEAAEYAAWMAETAPRLAAAQAAGDPFINRDHWPVDAADIPEFAPLRAALSAPARAHFDEEWRSQAEIAEWPGPWETALAIRDAPQAVAASIERDTMRMRLGRHNEDAAAFPHYPIGEEYEEFLSADTTPEDLRAEADALAMLARDALLMERMLRDHAAGRATSADDYE
ncbi:hypothetical protein AB0K60_19555 [Thermopolyspora sp. NPDC052614]|uniref:hypothetical protein n=1 Tax=Thermopolyspora sp. NPDC052614 TaxID=3155682 RepID=UPI00344333E8